MIDYSQYTSIEELDSATADDAKQNIIACTINGIKCLKLADICTYLSCHCSSVSHELKDKYVVPSDSEKVSRLNKYVKYEDAINFIVSYVRRTALITKHRVIEEYKTNADVLDELVANGILHLFVDRERKKFSIYELEANADTIRNYQQHNDRFTIQEAAKYLGVTKSTLHRRIACGTLKGHRDGKRLYFLKDELDASGGRHKESAENAVFSASEGNNMLSIAELSEQLQISKDAILAKINNGVIPYTRNEKGQLYANKFDVIAELVDNDNDFLDNPDMYEEIVSDTDNEETKSGQRMPRRFNNGRNLKSVTQIANEHGLTRDEVMSSSDASEYLNVPMFFIAEKRRQGSLRPIGRAGSTYVFKRADIENIKQHKSDGISTAFYVMYHCDTNELCAKVKALYERYGRPKFVFRDKTMATNRKRGALNTLIESCKRGRYDRVCVATRTELSVFDFEFVKSLFEASGTEVCVLADNDRTKRMNDRPLPQDIAVLIAAAINKNEQCLRNDDISDVIDAVNNVLDKQERRAIPLLSGNDIGLRGVSDRFELYEKLLKLNNN